MFGFQIISDTHAEFHRDGGKYFCENIPVVSPILVIAGDFATYDIVVKNITILAKRFENVIYVHGNHEHYGTFRKKVHNSMVKLSKRFSNFHYLNNKVVEINGQRFVGTTLWFRNSAENIFFRGMLNDFSMIPNFNKWVYEENSKAISFLEKEVKKGDVVITHHAPCTMSINEIHKGSPTNRFYVCDQTDLIYERKPVCWIHGHMHIPVDYFLHDTRVVSNPYGYIGHEETLHPTDYVKVIEI